MSVTIDGKESMVAAVSLGDYTLSYTAVLTLAAGNRGVSIAVPSAKAGDIISVRPRAAITDGYDIGAAYCIADGTVVIIVHYPALGIGASFNLPVRVFRIDK